GGALGGGASVAAVGGAVANTTIGAAVAAAATTVLMTGTGQGGGGGSDHGGDEGGKPPKKKMKAKDRRRAEQERDGAQRGRPTEGTPRNNQAQNAEFDDAARGLSKDQRRQLHEEFTKQNMTREEIIQRRNEMFPDNPYPGS